MRVVLIFLIVIITIAVLNWKLPGAFQLPKQEATVSQSVKPALKPNPSPTPLAADPSSEVSTEEEVSAEAEAPDVSPYYGKLKISGVQAKSNYHPSLITLNYHLIKGDKINITNWRLKVRKGEIIIPKAIEKYQSYITPGNIIIEQYGTIYLIGDKNPLGRDRNFRLNKCLGYLASSRDFYPSFYTYCPRPELEEISHLNPYCQEFILHLSSCEIPNYSNNLKIATDSKCTSYLNENFNYSGCFKNYSKDEDFLKNYWYIYVGSNLVEPLHDTILLLDQDNLLVDKYIY